MQDKIISVTEERALMLARLALTQNKILIIEDSLTDGATKDVGSMRRWDFEHLR